MVRGIIFDLDGTLISLHVDGAAFRKEIARELASSGFRMDLIEAAPGRLYVQDILDLAKAQVDDGLVRADFQAVRERTFRTLDALELEWIKHSRLQPGAEEVLSRLRSGGDSPMAIALLTNSGRAATRYAMDGLGLKKYFERSFTRDDLPAMKPRPEGLLTALAALGLSPGETLYVGDSPADIIATRRAGVRIASVSSGRYDAEALRTLGADYVLGSIAELADLVARLP